MWACEWDRFFCADQNYPPEKLLFAQKIDAAVNDDFESIRLEALPSDESMHPLLRSLPYRTTKRGYDLGNDHAQSAIELSNKIIGGSGLKSIPTLSRGQLIGHPGNHLGLGALEDIYPKIFSETPLWLYILRESKVLSAGGKLGPFSSLVVAETIYNAILSSSVNIFETERSSIFRGISCTSKSKIWDVIQYIK